MRTIAKLVANSRRLRSLGYGSIQRLRPVMTAMVQSAIIHQQVDEKEKFTYFDASAD